MVHVDELFLSFFRYFTYKLVYIKCTNVTDLTPIVLLPPICSFFHSAYTLMN